MLDVDHLHCLVVWCLEVDKLCVWLEVLLNFSWDGCVNEVDFNVELCEMFLEKSV